MTNLLHSQLAWTADRFGQILTLSSDLLAYAGQTVETCAASFEINMIHPADRAELSARWSRALNNRVDDHFQFRLHNRQGDCWCTVKLHVTPLVNVDRNIDVGLGTIEELDDFQAPEPAALLASIIESTDDAIITKDLNGIITSWNDSASALFGYTSAEVIGQSVTILFPTDRVDEELHIFKRIAGDHRIKNYETLRKRKDGSEFDVALTISPIHNSANVIVGASKILRDITEHKHSELELQKSQRLLAQARSFEVLGRLIGGVAHDFSNFLTIIIGNLQLQQYRSRSGSDSTLIGEALEAAERGARLTDKLSTFSRRSETGAILLDLNVRIENMAEMLRRTLGGNIELTVLLAPDLWPVRIEPGEAENALLNLICNARDAMPTGGKLVIETCNTTIKRGLSLELAPGDYVVLEISDTGVGMSEETLERAFEPFFTTKDVGKGTGLGLASVYGFVKQSRGRILIDSRIGQGTRVSLYFPRSVEDQVVLCASPMVISHH
jgi:PAS domain S-box-containing protein